MSKQLTLSSILAVLAMAGTAVLASTGERAKDIDGANHTPMVQQVDSTLHTS